MESIPSRPPALPTPLDEFWRRIESVVADVRDAIGPHFGAVGWHARLRASEDVLHARIDTPGWSIRLEGRRTPEKVGAFHAHDVAPFGRLESAYRIRVRRVTAGTSGEEATIWIDHWTRRWVASTLDLGPYAMDDRLELEILVFSWLSHRRNHPQVDAMRAAGRNPLRPPRPGDYSQ